MSYNTGDLVVLTCGSMRMAVEAVDGDNVACVWCHEGEIGRDSFNAKLLKKWEFREDDRPQRGGARGGDDRGGYKGKGGDDRGGYKGKRDADKGDDDRKPRGKTGWDGKPREKKYFRKDD